MAIALRSLRQCLARSLALIAAALLVAGCGPQVQERGGGQYTPVLEPGVAIMADGRELPVSRWYPEGDPEAILLGVHGFNDYRRAWQVVGDDLRSRGIATYAYDQRGFGATEHAGIWAGTERLVRDLATVAALLHQHYPDTPIFIAGESMGGAVTLVTHQRHPDLPIAGTLLLAPAVWSRDHMPWYQRAGLWIASQVAPDRRLSGSGVEVRPSDNREMLRELARDPLVQRGSRVDALNGLSNLMDRAQEAIPDYRGRTLILYGEQDEIIPRAPTCRMFQRLPAPERWRAVLYAEGYHMLTRDLQGDVVRGDIGDWVLDPDGPLSSGEETDLDGRLGAFCRRHL